MNTTTLPTIFLVGFPCCGKSTLGAPLAAELGVDFLDLDDYIEEQCQMSVREIFERLGQDKFRQLEREALRQVATRGGIVSTGGNTPCHSNNMALMNELGLTIWLTVAAERLVLRLCLPEHRSKRPLIAAKSDSEIARFVAQELERRTPFYSQAQLTFDATRIEDAAETLDTARRLAQVLGSL